LFKYSTASVRAASVPFFPFFAVQQKVPFCRVCPRKSGFAGFKREICNTETLRGQEAATAADTRQKKKSFTYGGGALLEETLGFSNQLVA
jgi:hypothetical protein